jgi:hypothetical protein
MTPQTTDRITTPKTSGWAVASLVLGILALPYAVITGMGFLGLVALICGIVARTDIKRGRAGGGIAVAGLVLAALALALALIHSFTY